MNANGRKYPRQSDYSRRNNPPFATFPEIVCGTCHARHVPAVGQLPPYPRSSAFVGGKRALYLTKDGGRR
jgi:hypothetical protein